VKSLLGGLLNKTPVPFDTISGRLFSTLGGGRNDAQSQMAAMGAVGTLFSVVHRTSNATALVEWGLYRKSVDGRRTYGSSAPPDRQQVTRHPALGLWEKPNSFMTRQELVEVVQQHIDLTGEGWILISRDPRSPMPLELWPVRPDRMEPVPSPTDFIAGYLYHGPNGEKVPLGRDEVIFLRMPNPLDAYRGMGPVQSIMVDLDASKYTAEWNRNFFLNSAEPGGIIEVEKRLSDPEWEELQKRWNEQHKGVRNAHRVAVIEQGKWADRSYSQRDMQFTELRGVSRDSILEAYGMPRSIIGITENVNKANAEAGEITFARWLSVPRLERFKQALNNDLLPLFADPTLEFDYDHPPVPRDSTEDAKELQARAVAVKTLVEAGYDPVEVLAACELPDMGYSKPVVPASPTPPIPADATAA